MYTHVHPHVCTACALHVQVLFGGVFGAVLLSWYYAIGWTAFIALTPPAHSGQYRGFYTFCMNIFFWVQQTIFASVVQATNNHQYAFATGAVWAVLGLGVLLTIDFEKGKRDANATVKHVKEATEVSQI